MPRWTKLAIRDLDSVLEYIAADDAESAQRVAQAIRSASERLDQFPQMGRNGAEMSTKELVVPGLPYILIYRQQGPTIQILRLLHSRQKWPVT
ncbi:type II toxin-antitoxin system RelE/ParE family toxin [Desulfomicrobium macestii]|uniref:type II toxin-antitoxin system RelE/ParE family toxin n=1 Tax=Desulfomicrobium macestii TaxID=90731 RepID=UPI00178B5460